VCRKIKNELYRLRAKEKKKKQHLSDWLKDTCCISRRYSHNKLLGYYVYFVTSNTLIPSVVLFLSLKCVGMFHVGVHH